MRPNKQQYIDVIKNGDDSKRKNMVLNFDGTFQLIYDFNAEDRHDFVGRSETYDIGNDYVGSVASENKTYIDESYAMFLKAWLGYKQHRTTGRYLDTYPSDTIEELEKAIDSMGNKK